MKLHYRIKVGAKIENNFLKFPILSSKILTSDRRILTYFTVWLLTQHKIRNSNSIIKENRSYHY